MSNNNQKDNVDYATKVILYTTYMGSVYPLYNLKDKDKHNEYSNTFADIDWHNTKDIDIY